MAKEIHVTKPLAVGNDSIAKGFLPLFFEVIFTFSKGTDCRKKMFNK